MLKWAITNGCECKLSKCVSAAIKEGHQHVLAWMHANDILELDNDFCEEATDAGQTEIVTWACANGAQWNASEYTRRTRYSYFNSDA